MRNINTIKLWTAAVGGFLSYALGGFDALLQALLYCMIIDYISGILKALYNRSLNSKIGFNGLLKKVMILLVVVLVSTMQRALKDAVPLREVVLVFYLSNEGISIIENLGAVIPIPAKVKEFFVQLKAGEENDGGGKAD